jgi:drug/metabolite transporter (DMT)-like permease
MTRSPRLGYALAAAAAAMWAVNGSLARFLLEDGMSAWHLSEMRSALSFVLLFGYLAIFRRGDLRIERRDVPRLAWLGVAGLACVHATYFLAIERLDIGVALVIQYLGPMLILIWLRVMHHRHLAPSLWGAVGLSAVGAFFVVEAYDVSGLDALGLLAAFGAAVTFAIYMMASEQAGRRHPPQTTLVWAFGFATLFWFIVRPPWTFPFEILGQADDLLYGLGVAVVGTLIPFVLIVTAVRHIPSARAAVVATLEPVLAAIIAWPVHDQVLGPPQILGGAIVVAAVIWVQSHRPDVAAEAAP